jgi:Tfp pilus assembly protein PilF
MKYLVLLLALIAGCATAPEPGPETPPATEPAPEAQQKRENVAIAGLMESARADSAAGRLANAAASLERALRIEPRNPRLWQELARVRLKQGEYAQVESLAARSNSWAGSDGALRAENQRLIEEAREAGRLPR